MNLLLCGLWTLLIAAGVVCRAVAPAAVLPTLDVPQLVAVCLMALLLECWIYKRQRRSWAIMTALAALTFGLLPMCAGMAGGVEALKLAAAGGVVFLASGVIFDSMAARIATGAHTSAAYPLAAFLLFLASQGLANIFF